MFDSAIGNSESIPNTGSPRFRRLPENLRRMVRLLPLVLISSAVSAMAQPLKLPVDLPSSSGYQLAEAMPGLSFQQPLAIASAPGRKDAVFIVEKGGKVQLVTGYPGKPEKSVFMDLKKILDSKGKGTLGTEGEWGLLGLAFHPRYAENGYFFVAYDMKVNEGGKTQGFNCVSRFTRSTTHSDEVDPDSEMPMISQLDPGAYHNGGDIHFGPDGYLYYAMGDSGGHYDPNDTARFIDKDFFAAVYRLDVDQKPGNLPPNAHKQASTAFPSAVHTGSYKIPADNPFVKATRHNGKPLDPSEIRTEVYACGFRNPWRFSFDSKNGDLYLGVVGEDRWEQVYLIKPGINGGWSYYEGSHDGPRLKDKPAGGDFTKPIYEYPHGNDTIYSGNSVTGGVVSRGGSLKELEGAYIFGDYISHCVWAIRKNGDKWIPQLLTRGGAVSAFGIDPMTGDILLADIDGGRIQKLGRAPERETPPPPRLSQTGAFANLATLEPSPGVIPYEVNHGAWNGGAVSRRWISLPGKERIGFNLKNSWSFPTGTVWIQQLVESSTNGAPARRLETRFLVKTETSVYGITYKWLPDQKDALLVPEGGLPASPQDHGRPTPGRSECLMCHTAIAGYTLGMNTWQLNRPSLADPKINQIQSLIDGGQLEGAPADFSQAPSFAGLADTNRSLEDRCRAYLAVNCSHCHQQDGVASSHWTTRATYGTSQSRMLNGGLNTDFGDNRNKVIAPNDPDHSMILKRLKGDGVPRMPMGSTGPVDQAGISLITEWIKAGAPAAR